jgi:class 3 adenylate cyclase
MNSSPQTAETPTADPSRIAEYARPGEVLVTQEVVDASAGVEVTFTEIGPVELKGISGVHLHAARRAEAR